MTIAFSAGLGQIDEACYLERQFDSRQIAAGIEVA
jgi:hypothetical protein